MTDALTLPRPAKPVPAGLRANVIEQSLHGGRRVAPSSSRHGEAMAYRGLDVLRPFDAPPAATHPCTPVPRRILLPCQMRTLSGHIQQHLDMPLSVLMLAGLVGFSRSHFCRAFKTAFGMPPHQYVTRRRLARAIELIGSTPRSLTDIAAACGFYDQSHMCHVFRRTFGRSPGHFRVADWPSVAVPPAPARVAA